MNHHLYLVVAFATHALVGYAVVGALTDLPRAAGVAGSLLPDVDLYLGPVLGLPVVHRGVLHTPAAALALGGGLLLGSLSFDVVRRRVGAFDVPGREGGAFGLPRRGLAAFGVGFLTHLVLDSFTSAGVMWAYPASAARVALGLPIHGAVGTAVLWAASLALLRYGPGLGRRVHGGSDRASPPRR